MFLKISPAKWRQFCPRGDGLTWGAWTFEVQWYQRSGSRLNVKTVVRPSYLYNENLYPDKPSSLYWDGPQVPCEADIHLTSKQRISLFGRTAQMILWGYFYASRNPSRVIIPPATKLGVYIGFTLSVCLSVCPLTFHVRPVASTVKDGFFPYLVQMINSMIGYVAGDNPWPWPIPSRSFGIGLENRVRSVASTILDRLFLYLVQMITIFRGFVACFVFFGIWKSELLAIFYISFGFDLEKKSAVVDGLFPYLEKMITSVRGCVAYNDLWPWPISSRSFGHGLKNRFRSVASTVLDKFFPYFVQMITSIRRCVACDDLWPWSIYLRSYDLEVENRVHSVTFSDLDWLFPYLPQIVTTIRGCVAC